MATTIADLITKKETQLANVEASIEKAEKQQLYDLDDGQGKQKVQRGDLKTMYAERDKLQAEILELENGSSSSFYARLS